MSQLNVYPRFSMVLTVPKMITKWWACLQESGHHDAKGYLGHLPTLLRVPPCRDIIEAATVFWDEERSVFRFRENELTQLLEEIGGYVENVRVLIRYSSKKVGIIFPNPPLQNECANKFGFREGYGNECMHPEKIPLEYLYNRFGRSNSLKLYGHEFESDEDWKEKRIFAFVVSFLGTILFPKGTEQEIPTSLVTVADAMINGIGGKPFTIVPMILADIYRALGKCKNGYKHFEGCNLLLQIWLMDHLYKTHVRPTTFRSDARDYLHVPGAVIIRPAFQRPRNTEEWVSFFNRLEDSSIQWMVDWFPSDTIITGTRTLPFLVARFCTA